VKIRTDLLEWMHQQIEKKTYWNASHAVEVALLKLRESEKEKETQEVPE
jgi:Arc/MetJ-type ribon-helix-helix transcriptional regulator